MSALTHLANLHRIYRKNCMHAIPVWFIMVFKLGLCYPGKTEQKQTIHTQYRLPFQNKGTLNGAMLTILKANVFNVHNLIKLAHLCIKSQDCDAGWKKRKRETQRM